MGYTGRGMVEQLGTPWGVGLGNHAIPLPPPSFPWTLSFAGRRDGVRHLPA